MNTVCQVYDLFFFACYVYRPSGSISLIKIQMLVFYLNQFKQGNSLGKRRSSRYGMLIKRNPNSRAAKSMFCFTETQAALSRLTKHGLRYRDSPSVRRHTGYDHTGLGYLTAYHPQT